MLSLKITMQQLFELAIFAVLFLNLTNEIDSKPTQNSTSYNAVQFDEHFAVVSKNSNENEIKKNDDDSEFRLQYAKKMLTFMNQSVDPCDDFYEYACGNWKNVIQERQAIHKRSHLIDIVYILADHVEEILQRSPESLELDYASELAVAQKFYNICLAADLYPMKKSEAYIELIKSIGGFPAIDDTWHVTADNFSWFNMSAHLSNYGASSLINEQIWTMYPFLPYFKLPDLGFEYFVHSDNIRSNVSRGYRLNEKRMREYLATYGVADTKISQIISDIFEFWHAVLQVTDEFNEDLTQCSLLSGINETTSFAQWDNYFAIAWNGIDFNRTEDDCPCDYFYTKLDAICDEHKEAVANYLAMMFLFSMDARLQDRKFQKEYCVTTVQFAFPYLFDKLYLAEHFTEDIRTEVSKMITEIRKSMFGALKDADWLDESTRAEALLKESTLISHIGSFEDPELTERLIRAMNNLTFVDDNYEKSYLALKKFKKFEKRFNGLHHDELDKNLTKPLELLVAMQVNSFYYALDNSINVMAGILHPPAYHKAWPNSLKFGTFGYLMGHEITHGFDWSGADFDSNGSERNWWSKKSSKVFGERTGCYVDHYGDFLIPEINRKVNGNKTKDENIADSGGLREGLTAYRRYMKKLNKEEPAQQTLLIEEQMPGINLSPEQLFFLGFAQVWCAAYKEEHYWEELSNAHTINKYRVLGAVRNNEEFAKVYECPLGSKMNPKTDKCRIW